MKTDKIREFGAQCGREMRTAGGPHPVDADGNSMPPEAPLPGDWAALTLSLGRPPTKSEAAAFYAGWCAGADEEV